MAGTSAAAEQVEESLGDIEFSRAPRGISDMQQEIIQSDSALEDLAAESSRTWGNINRGALSDLLPAFRRRLAPGGQVVLAGLLASDRAPMLDRAAACGLAPREEANEGGWWAVRLGVEARGRGSGGEKKP